MKSVRISVIFSFLLALFVRWHFSASSLPFIPPHFPWNKNETVNQFARISFIWFGNCALRSHWGSPFIPVGTSHRRKILYQLFISSVWVSYKDKTNSRNWIINRALVFRLVGFALEKPGFALEKPLSVFKFLRSSQSILTGKWYAGTPWNLYFQNKQFTASFTTYILLRRDYAEIPWNGVDLL